MLLLKIISKKGTKYFKFEDVEYVSLKKERRIGIKLDGDIEFNFSNNKWYVTNKLNTKLKVGHHHLKPNCSRVLKINKIIKVDDYKIVSIEYKTKEVKNKKVSPGLVNFKYDLSTKTEHIIGSDESSDIIIANPQVDKQNTRIIHDGDFYYIEDIKSSNGLIINGKKCKNKLLEDYDSIELPGSIYMFIDHYLLHSEANDGIKIDVHHVTKTVKDFNSKNSVNLVNDINLTINAGEYVAIVGGSGAGKSTFLDCINGRRPMTDGKVYYDLNDFYKYFNAYQKIVGYVPQSDIMHTDLSVFYTLYYYAQIRMHHHLNKKELTKLVNDTLKVVSLYEKKDLRVSSLSGGQKKRVSIAMELLANPKVIFLDEPTSGLSPDLDFELMNLLKELSNRGKTVIIITHNMDNVDKCDKIAFLGKGGHLCYYGSPSEIFEYFGVSKYGEIFVLLSDEKNVKIYEEKLRASTSYIEMCQQLDKTYEGSDEQC